LLLDEPTNHLDLDMREALAEALSDFAGAIVLVSHDRHLIGLVCDTFWRVADGHVEAFDGDLDAYAAWLRSRGSEPKKSQVDPPPKKAAAKASDSDPLSKQQRSRFKQVESRMVALQSELAQIEAQLADPAIYGNDGGIEIGQLGQRQEALTREHAALETEWLALYERLETA